LTKHAYCDKIITIDEAFRIFIETEGGEALENPERSGAEGAKGVYALRISQAKGQSGVFLCLNGLYFLKAASIGSFIFLFSRRLVCKRSQIFFFQ
jgi:hypothetical protein